SHDGRPLYPGCVHCPIRSSCRVVSSVKSARRGEAISLVRTEYERLQTVLQHQLRGVLTSYGLRRVPLAAWVIDAAESQASHGVSLRTRTSPGSVGDPVMEEEYGLQASSCH